MYLKYGMLLSTTYNGRRYTYPNSTIREHLISDHNQDSIRMKRKPGYTDVHNLIFGETKEIVMITHGYVY